MGRAGRERAVKLYTWENVAAKMMEEYQRILPTVIDEAPAVPKLQLAD